MTKTESRNTAWKAMREVLIRLHCALLIGCLVLTPAAEALQEPFLGDAPADPGPLATDLSPGTDTHAVQAAMRRVADWELNRVKDTPSQDWTYAALYIGMLAASDTLKDERYRDSVTSVATHFGWTLGPRKAHADDQAIGQSYLALYGHDADPLRISGVRAQFDQLIQMPDVPHKPVWWWCDALFMAPPVWAQLAAITHDARYLATMDREWHITSDLLWDRDEHLFFRDDSYFTKREKNGRKVFWSRGNGWVIAGLARVLTYMPQKDPRRAFYVAKFKQMAERLRGLQGADGLWRPGLLDAEAYPYPEVSGSAFYVYAMAWGIRHGLLSGGDYVPVVEKGWAGLVTHIYRDGRLGSIQPIGAAPDAYSPGSSYVFGVGAFLLAGSEVAHLHKKNAGRD